MSSLILLYHDVQGLQLLNLNEPKLIALNDHFKQLNHYDLRLNVLNCEQLDHDALWLVILNDVPKQLIHDGLRLLIHDAIGLLIALNDDLGLLIHDFLWLVALNDLN